MGEAPRSESDRGYGGFIGSEQAPTRLTAKTAKGFFLKKEAKAFAHLHRAFAVSQQLR